MERDRDCDDDSLKFVERVEDADRQRLPKRYVRDHENPLEFYEENEFRRRYRFSKETVSNRILPIVSEGLVKVNNRGLQFAPVIQLSTCLRFYATGNFQTVTSDLRGMSQQFVSQVIKRVSIMFAENLPQYVKFPPTENKQRLNITRFSQIGDFPGVAACVDCTHIPFANPGGDNGEVFRSRKGYFSLNVQVAVGARMEILDIDVKNPGSAHDGVIFDRSSLRVRFEERHIQCLILGDNGYPCRPYLLTPVIQPGNPHQVGYNTFHIRTRNIVERVFGIMKPRFPCSRRQLSTELRTSQAIICTAAVLHNIAIDDNNYIDGDDMVAGDVPIINGENNPIGLIFRDHFINQYF